ncbi:hypothetical protein [Lysinibacillus sp. RC79]|uniref:hypothetical protein n=1 Tax=Lysinibacillus sp. RC79 TaxID=3156296 RepID=UPI003515C19E
MGSQVVVVNGKLLDLAILAEYMNDELRERIHDEMIVPSDQLYIDCYILLVKYNKLATCNW